MRPIKDIIRFLGSAFVFDLSLIRTGCAVGNGNGNGDFKELGVLGYLLQWRSHLLGVPMSGRSEEWKSRCNFPPAGGQVAPPAFNDEWASPFNGRSEKSGIDEWESRCNFPPAGGKVAPPAFYDGLGVPIEWASRWIGRSR